MKILMTKVWKHSFDDVIDETFEYKNYLVSRVSLSMLPWNRNLATRSPYYVGEVCRRSNVI